MNPVIQRATMYLARKQANEGVIPPEMRTRGQRMADYATYNPNKTSAVVGILLAAEEYLRNGWLNKKGWGWRNAANSLIKGTGGALAVRGALGLTNRAMQRSRAYADTMNADDVRSLVNDLILNPDIVKPIRGEHVAKQLNNGSVDYNNLSDAQKKELESYVKTGKGDDRTIVQTVLENAKGNTSKSNGERMNELNNSTGSNPEATVSGAIDYPDNGSENKLDAFGITNPTDDPRQRGF